MEKKKTIISIITFTLGIIVLIVGVVFLVLGINRGSSMDDAEYLVAQEKWTLEDEDKVVWDFTEIGKGTLTTNGHENDYEFKWALEDGKLKIETDWLYELENEYDYSLDQSGGILVLKADGEEHRFVTNQ
ncbi:hypothetical protein IKE97_00555 [Candidatus Saccharibacteria bacterium]|nr:hypothetical protein [Candidatus Saccharibacteria bacterium]